ncbi:docking protein 3 isoform X1 [Mustela nigripes]|uniref:Docking protein 3 isoform X2 n=1 Tax=Mustela putorius furo TaxID=9669 RepID=A0A8U0UYY7_MUSPF|nr:docking protein 3 isoform X2 [Mustela putorius furo]XP_059030436.1 docking protein 3 isoform X1 [Mustela lutreola]XP_059273463.1 docking protein 3 isoform X1 [Mustela nigripes]
MEPLETPVKDGILYQQHIKFGKKSWRKVWGLLYAGSPSGVARLESWEVREGGLGPTGDRPTGPSRRGERRVIRLADCVSVLPADGESCPKDTSAFLLTTTERSHLLAAQHRQEWMGPICQLAFQGTGESSSGPGEVEASKRGLVPMEENSIYSSWQEGEFPVVVQRTEAATRCQLKGPYLLVLGQDTIQLREASSPQALYTWPYRFLRKFGSDKDVFSFEAGRRCDSGEGLFAFSSPRAPDLCRAVAAAIARQRERLPELAGPRPCPLPRATSLPSLDPPGELREMPPGLEPPSSWRAQLADPGPQSLPPQLNPVPHDEPVSGLYASVCKRASGPPANAEHLYENLCMLEAGPVLLRDGDPGQEGSSRRSPLASPIYHNSEDLGWPGPTHDSSLEAQYRRLLELELGDSDETVSSGRPSAPTGFKAKLVTLLSRERKKGPAPCDRP